MKDLYEILMVPSVMYVVDALSVRGEQRHKLQVTEVMCVNSLCAVSISVEVRI